MITDTSIVKTRHFGWVSSDFYDFAGNRRFCFEFCRYKLPPSMGMESLAIVNFSDGELTRVICAVKYEHREKAIVRLARKYLQKSVPNKFL